MELAFQQDKGRLDIKTQTLIAKLMLNDRLRQT